MYYNGVVAGGFSRQSQRLYTEVRQTIEEIVPALVRLSLLIVADCHTALTVLHRFFVQMQVFMFACFGRGAEMHRRCCDMRSEICRC